MDAAAKNQVFDIVRRELDRIRREQAPDCDVEIRMESSLTADLGLDSISLVEVIVALERALQIDQLPLASWSDRESDRDDERFTVASLVNLCLEHAPA